MNTEPKQILEFGKFRLDVGQKILWHEREEVSMPLKELEVLCLLVENQGKLVSKNEILDKIWTDSFAGENNLSRHIYLLRKTLRDFGADNLIENVPRRGYRFSGAVNSISNGEMVVEKHTRTQTLIEFEEEGKEIEERKNAEKNKKYLLAFSAVAALLAVLVSGAAFFNYQNRQSAASISEIKTIAVLPFKSINSDGQNDHRGLGLADVLITRLSSIKEISVRPASAVVSFENQESDSISFGQKLNVDAVLEGTIYQTNENVRVSARLLKVSDQTVIWTGQFEKSAADEFRLQNEIALQVADALRINLSRTERNALSKNLTENEDAYQFYLRGRYEWNKRTWQGMIDAERLFRNAIERDPNFALAYVGLADTLAINGSEQAFEAANKALELDADLAEPHATLGFLKTFHHWQWQDAENEFRKSIELNPNYGSAHHWYAELLAIQGRHEQAKTEMRKALEINPLSHNYLADLGQIYYFNREYKEAEEYCRKALEIYPDFEFAHNYLFDIYLKTGEYDKAVESKIAADKIYSTFANQTAERQKQIETELDAKRKIYRNGGIYKFMKARVGETQDGNVCYVVARNQAFLGEKEKALDCLEKAFAGRSFLSAFVKADPVFDDLRNEPRYRKILRGMNLQ